jgi:ribosomal protein L32
MYQCSHCGATMSTPLDRCPSCGILLSGVKCQSCGYVGGKNEFINNNNRCPKCNRAVHVSTRPAEIIHCKNCGETMKPKDWICLRCGLIRWKKIVPEIVGLGVLVLGYIALVGLIIYSRMQGNSTASVWIIACFGIPCLLVMYWFIHEVIKMIRTIKLRNSILSKINQ